MRNPKYAEVGFLATPRPETCAKLCMLSSLGGVPNPQFGIGIKTIVESYNGLKLKPHKTVVVEISEGNERSSFDLPVSFTRLIASRMLEFCDAIEAEKAS